MRKLSLFLFFFIIISLLVINQSPVAVYASPDWLTGWNYGGGTDNDADVYLGTDEAMFDDGYSTNIFGGTVDGEPTTLLSDDESQIDVWFYRGDGATGRIRYTYTTDGVNYAGITDTDIPQGYLRAHILKHNGTYYTYASTVAGTNFYLFTSTNKINWTYQGIVLSLGTGWEGSTLGNMFVWVEGSTWYMLYEACGTPFSTYKWAIGLANSTNGISWVKYENNPVLTEANLPGGCGRPILPRIKSEVLKHDNKYYLYYHSQTSVSFEGIRRAYSANLKSWTKEGEIEGVVEESGYITYGDHSLVQFQNKTFLYYTPSNQVSASHINVVKENKTLSDILALSPTGSEDNIPPITIDDYNGLWRNTDFTITLIATDLESGVAETYYRINDGPVKDTSIDGQPFITTEGANNKLEYWSIDNAGNEELPHKILTGIKLDKTAPTGSIIINNGDAYTTSTSVTLTLTATDLTSGVYQVRYSNDGVWDTELWEDLSPTKAWTLTQGDGVKTVYYQIKDNAGLVSITYSDTIILDTSPPTGSITINDEATYTTTTSVTLTLSATDATSGIAEMHFSNDNTTWTPWEPYSTSKAWTFTTGDGTKAVYVQYRDKAGLISPSYQDTIILDTTKPTANAGTDQTVNEDTLVTFDASASTDENGIATYTWTFTDVTPQTLTGKNPTYTFANPGTYTFTLKVTDPAGNTATDIVIITVLDVTKPIANAGLDRTVNEDTQITLDGSASSDNVAITAYTWAFTDVTTKTLTGEKPTYTFNTPGVYTVTLNVTDAAGNWATDTVIITVIDISKPTANAGQDQTVTVGTTVSFDASGSTDNVGTVSYEWDFGDGRTGTGKTTTHTYTSPGTYTVTLTVKDAADNTATHQITVTVLPIEAFPIWIVGVVVATIAIVALGIALYFLKIRKH